MGNIKNMPHNYTNCLVMKHHSVWKSFSTVTHSRSLVIVYDGICVLQIGYASYNEGEPMVVDSDKLMQGSTYQGVVKSGSCKPHMMIFKIHANSDPASSGMCF